MTTTCVIAGLAVSAALTLSSCAADPSSNKTGAPSRPLVVEMADSQPADAPSSLAMVMFADRVEELSDGAIVVETTSEGPYADNHGDGKVVAAVVAGDVELGIVPTRAWSDAGARSADILQAPFEIGDNAHMVAVAQDETLVEAALADLEGLGVHGLGVVPERLRTMVSFGEPYLRPSDLDGKTVRDVRARASETYSGFWVRSPPIPTTTRTPRCVPMARCRAARPTS